ncbi:hypothetical protein C0J52_25047 [Blattella germanica]|nr:hypothetical protein C0J52_25047 [Blattella germanica]
MYVLICLLYAKNNLGNFATNGDCHDHMTRNRKNLQIRKNKYRYTVIKNSFHSISIKLFNSSPSVVKHLPVNNFRAQLRSTLTANPLYKLGEFFYISHAGKRLIESQHHLHKKQVKRNVLKKEDTRDMLKVLLVLAGHECLETYLFADDLALNIITDKNDTLISGAVENFTENVNSWCNANNLSINRNKTENIEFNLCRTHTENTVSLLWPLYPHLNYGILLWGNHSSAKSLFILQKRAIRIIHGAPPRTHCKPLFIKLGILTLPSMYVLASLLHVKRNINQLV